MICARCSGLYSAEMLPSQQTLPVLNHHDNMILYLALSLLYTVIHSSLGNNTILYMVYLRTFIYKQLSRLRQKPALNNRLRTRPRQVLEIRSNDSRCLLVLITLYSPQQPFNFHPPITRLRNPSQFLLCLLSRHLSTARSFLRAISLIVS